MAPLVHHTAPDILGCQSVPKGDSNRLRAPSAEGCLLHSIVSTLADTYSGKIVLVQRGTCTFVTKATRRALCRPLLTTQRSGQVRNMQLAGAVAVIVHDNIYEGFIHMANDNTQDQPTIPAIFITKSEGNYLVQLLAKANQGAIGLAAEDQVVQVWRHFYPPEPRLSLLQLSVTWVTCIH